MNQTVISGIALSEARMRGENVETIIRRIGYGEALRYKPDSCVLYFQAAAQGEHPFDQRAAFTPVHVVGILRNKSDYAGNAETMRRLAEEPDDFKIGTHAHSRRSFLVPFRDAVAFGGESVNLTQEAYESVDAPAGIRTLAIA